VLGQSSTGSHVDSDCLCSFTSRLTPINPSFLQRTPCTPSLSFDHLLNPVAVCIDKCAITFVTCPLFQFIIHILCPPWPIELMVIRFNLFHYSIGYIVISLVQDTMLITTWSMFPLYSDWPYCPSRKENIICKQFGNNTLFFFLVPLTLTLQHSNFPTDFHNFYILISTFYLSSVHMPAYLD
jgi:hypothetical protein